MAENEQVEPEVDEAEVMQQLREELKSLTVSDHLLFMMHSLSALAVDRMRLTEQAGGRRDLDEARLAIDGFRALLELVGRARSPEEMAAQRSVLSQLQMNYVAVLGQGEVKEAPPTEAAEESPAETEEPPAAEAAEGSPAETAEESPAEAAEESPQGPSETRGETASGAAPTAPEDTSTETAPEASDAAPEAEATPDAAPEAAPEAAVDTPSDTAPGEPPQNSADTPSDESGREN